MVLVSILGAIGFTFGTGFVNLFGFKHAISVIRGRYDDPDAPGEVTHSQAFSSALSATVGLGNIAGVAVAVHKGGPGAVFWMMFLAFFGMASKFVESTLAQQYREIHEDGHVEGGAFLYLSKGLAERGAWGRPAARRRSSPSFASAAALAAGTCSMNWKPSPQ